MENQHRKITGYRELSQKEVDLMNEVKAQAEATKETLHKIIMLRADDLNIETEGLTIKQLEESERCIDIAQTNLQQGFMWLTRSVALPESF